MKITAEHLQSGKWHLFFCWGEIRNARYVFYSCTYKAYFYCIHSSPSGVPHGSHTSSFKSFNLNLWLTSNKSCGYCCLQQFLHKEVTTRSLLQNMSLCKQKKHNWTVMGNTAMWWLLSHECQTNFVLSYWVTSLVFAILPCTGNTLVAPAGIKHRPAGIRGLYFNPVVELHPASWQWDVGIKRRRK